MSRRRLNYTGRVKIARNCARVALRLTDDGTPPVFDLDLNLADYDFPREARVRIEAWRGHSLQRWNYGTVGGRETPSTADRRLTEVPVSCQFRVSVIAADRSGRLLGASGPIRPTQPHRSLLPLVEVDDLGAEVWRLGFGAADALDQPELQVNSEVPGISEIVRHDPAFRALVMPAVLREILVRMVTDEGSDPADEEHSMHEWYRFAVRLVPPAGTNLSEEPAVRFEWVDQVVAAFAKSSMNAVATYIKARSGQSA